MTFSETETLERYRAAVSVLAGLPADVESYRALSEPILLQLNQLRVTGHRILGGAGR